MPKLNRRIVGSRSYRNWSDENLEKCLEDIRTGIRSQRQAAAFYNIPRSTLKNKIKGKFNKKPGRPTALSSTEEDSLIDHIKVLSEFGFPITEMDLRFAVKLYLDRKGKVTDFRDNLPGYDWVKLFLHRHKELSTRMASNIKRVRAAVDEKVIGSYFEHLEKSMEGITSENCWNYDETNVTDDPGNVKVICKRGAKYVENVMNTTKASTSLMLCGNAEGEILPPYVVYKAEKMWDLWTDGGPKGCRYNRSKSGWFDAHIFQDWFFSQVLPRLKKCEGPKALIGDNLSSHISEKVIVACQDNNIRFICLPPNSTHITQPLDVAYFHPLKLAWRNILREWKKSPVGETSSTVSKDIFPSLLKNLIDVTLVDKGKNLKAGFSKCGIVPLNKQQVLDRLPHDEEVNKDLVSEAFLEAVKMKRQELGNGPGKQTRKRKKVNVEPGKSICPDDFLEPQLPQNEKENKRGRPKKILPVVPVPVLGDLNSLSSSSKESKHKKQIDCEESSDDTDDSSFSLHDDSCEDPFEFSNSSSEDEVDHDDMISDQSVKETLCIGAFVAVSYNETLYPGCVTCINKTPRDGEHPILVDCMTKGKKSWKWPDRQDILSCDWCDIKKVIKPPTLLRRGYFSVPELDSFL